jgi:hypothetical protein
MCASFVQLLCNFVQICASFLHNFELFEFFIDTLKKEKSLENQGF